MNKVKPLNSRREKVSEELPASQAIKIRFTLLRGGDVRPIYRRFSQTLRAQISNKVYFLTSDKYFICFTVRLFEYLIVASLQNSLIESSSF
jgi:hypothetical protein